MIASWSISWKTWRPFWLIGLEPPTATTGQQSISALAMPGLMVLLCSLTVRSAQLKQRGIASFSPKTVERSFFRKSLQGDVGMPCAREGQRPIDSTQRTLAPGIVTHNNGIELLVPKHLLFVTLNA
jgi:hypothetical protein